MEKYRFSVMEKGKIFIGITILPPSQKTRYDS